MAVDLKNLGTPEGTAAAEPEPPRPPQTAPYDPGPERENIRGRIALRLVWVLIGLVTGIFLLFVLTVWNCSGSECNDQTKNLEAVKTMSGLLLTPIVALVGAVSGFYFGAQSAKST